MCRIFLKMVIAVISITLLTVPLTGCVEGEKKDKELNLLGANDTQDLKEVTLKLSHLLH